LAWPSRHQIVNTTIHGVRNNAKYMCVRRMSLLQAVFFMVESDAITIEKLRAPYAPNPPSQPKNGQNTDVAKLWSAIATLNPQGTERFENWRNWACIGEAALPTFSALLEKEGLF